MSIYQTIFGAKTPAAPAPNPQGGTQPNPNGQKQQQTLDPNASAQLESTKQGSQGQPDGGKPQPTPLAKYDNLFDDPTNNQPTPQNGEQNPQGKNPGKPQAVNYAEHAKNLNFSRTIDPVIMQKAVAGDVQAFSSVIDSVARSAWAASAKAAEQISQRGITDFETRFGSELPGKFREFSLNTTSTKHPILSKPSVKPLVAAIKQRMAGIYPDATPQELQQQAEDYFLAMNEEITGEQTKTQQAEQVNQVSDAKRVQEQQANGEFDWDEHYGLKPPQSQQNTM